MLTLSVPSTDPALQQTGETRPKALAAWLERLPYASPVDTAQQLITALYALNRRPLDESDRTALLALVRPVVVRVSASLETLLAESGVPPHAQQRQVGALLRELQIEHSIGYKHLLLALTSHRFGRAHSRRTAEITAQLLAALRDIQTACHLTHTALPAGLWQEMHTLHAYAQATNQADDAAGDAPSPSLAYRQALLIALADPPHMSHAEIILTRRYLDQFAGLAQLVAAPVSTHRGFAIQTDGDTAPNPHAASQHPGNLWLDTDALCRHLHETIIQLRGGATPRRIGLPPEMESEPSQTLCKRLLKQWSSGAARAFKRYATPGRTVQAVAGVSAIHRLLDVAPQAAQPDPDEADNQSIQVIEPALAAPAAVNTILWIGNNDSAAGLALSGAPDIALNLKVGDPLAVRVSDATEWSLGVIRWIRMRDARQVEFGVERLSPQIQPVWVRPLRGGKTPEPALFVPGLPALKQNDRLLLPRHLYQIGMDAEVWHTSHLYTLTFGRRFEHTQSFDLIDFTVFADVRT
jgi:cyclic-di-GMP-binding protein